MKTTSLELSKQLKECGFPQKTDFYWSNEIGNTEVMFSDKLHLAYNPNYLDFIPEYEEHGDFQLIAAPTAEEILEQLPTRPKDNSHMQLVIWKGSEWTGWNIAYKQMYHDCDRKDKLGHQHDTKDDDNNSLAELAGRLYLYLKKEGLL